MRMSDFGAQPFDDLLGDQLVPTQVDVTTAIDVNRALCCVEDVDQTEYLDAFRCEFTNPSDGVRVWAHQNPEAIMRDRPLLVSEFPSRHVL